MPIRAFISSWQLVDGEIHNPILDHVDTQADMGITLSMIYPDADANGLPDKPVVLVLAESHQVPGPVLEQLGNLDGVDLVPPQRPNKRINTLPAAARADLEALVSRHKIPQAVVTGATTIGDALAAIEKHLAPSSNGVARYLVQRAAEFG